MIKISKGSFATMIGFTMEAAPIGIGISPIVRVSGEDSWLVPWIALPVVLLLLWPLFRLFHSRGDLLFYNDPPSRSLSVALFPLALILIFLIAFNTRVFVDLIHMTYLPLTPEMVIYMCVLGVCSYAATMGGEVIGRVSLISFVVKFLVMTLAPIFAIGQMQFHFLTPFMADGVMPLIRSAIQPVAWFCEASLLVLLWPLVKNANYRTVALGYTVGLITYWILTISCLLIFSAQLTERFVYPGLEFVQMMAMGDFLERIDAILASIWTMSMVVKISIYLYLLSIVISRIFTVNIRSHFVYPVALVASFSADMIAKNFPQYMMVYRYAWPVLVVVLMLNLYVIGWLCARIKQKQEQQTGQQASGPPDEAQTVTR